MISNFITPGGLSLTVDCSTTAAKAVVFDPDGNAVALARRPLAMDQPRAGWHEQDAREWWAATRGALTDVIAQLDDPSRIAALCLTHQRESFVCLGEDDLPLRPAILWLDSRADAEIARYGSTAVQALSGKPADITPAIYKLAWLRSHEPETLSQANRIGDVSAYLTWQLTGRWATSSASADTLGLFDLRANRWSSELLDIAGVRREQLPKLVAPGDIVGNIKDDLARSLGLSNAIPVIAGIGDGQAAGLGADVTGPGIAYLNLGTALVMGVQSREYQWGPAFRTMASAIAGQYTLETFLSSGTYLTTWYRQQFGNPKLDGAPDPDLEASAAAVRPGADGLLTVPYWNSAQTPYWDHDAKGIIVGWQGNHTRAHVYRSILEGIAFELRLHLQGLEAATGEHVATLRAMGGGTRSRLWTQIIADVTGRPLQICAEEEISALGAGVLIQAATRGGQTDVLHEVAARSARYSGTVVPDTRAARAYDAYFAIYQRLYEQFREIFPELSAARRLIESSRS